MARVATQKLAERLRQLRRLLTEQIDPLIDPLRTTAPEHYTRYRAARVTLQSPRRAHDDTAPSNEVTAPAESSLRPA